MQLPACKRNLDGRQRIEGLERELADRDEKIQVIGSVVEADADKSRRASDN
jgi:hypothetical protein